MTITNQEENNFVAGLVTEGIVIIGFTDKVREGEWKWITNEPVTYTNWPIGEPVDAGQEDYAAISNDGEWHDLQVYEEMPYICEWDSDSRVKIVDGNSSPNDIFSNLFPLGVRIFLFVIICVLLGYSLNKTRIK